MRLTMKGIPYLFCCFFLSSSIFAATPVHKYIPNSSLKPISQIQHSVTPLNHFEIIGGLGVAKLNTGNPYLGVTSSETDRLVQTNQNNWSSFATQLGFGYVYNFNYALLYPQHLQWFTALEPQVNLYNLAGTTLQGNVWRFNNSNFNQLTYNMQVRSTRLMLDLAVTVAAYQHLSLYAIGGIGEAWTRISYSDLNNNAHPCTDQQVTLNSKNNSNFAWEIGAGLLYSINDRFGLSLEYLYAPLGNPKASTSGTTGTITAPIISMSNLDLNSQSALLGLHITL